MNTAEAVQYQHANPEVARQGQEKLQAMLARSATDMDFRRKLLENPRAAVSEFTGRPVPESFNVRFVDAQGEPTVVLPDYVDPNVALSDAELEAVSGGWIAIAAALFCAFVAGATTPD
jgi:hypothetical protein